MALGHLLVTIVIDKSVSAYFWNDTPCHYYGYTQLIMTNRQWPALFPTRLVCAPTFGGSDFDRRARWHNITRISSLYLNVPNQRMYWHLTTNHSAFHATTFR